MSKYLVNFLKIKETVKGHRHLASLNQIAIWADWICMMQKNASFQTLNLMVRYVEIKYVCKLPAWNKRLNIQDRQIS